MGGGRISHCCSRMVGNILCSSMHCSFHHVYPRYWMECFLATVTFPHHPGPVYYEISTSNIALNYPLYRYSEQRYKQGWFCHFKGGEVSQCGGNIKICCAVRRSMVRSLWIIRMVLTFARTLFINACVSSFRLLKVTHLLLEIFVQVISYSSILRYTT